MMHYVSDYFGTLSFPQTSLNHYRQWMVVTQDETTHQIKSLIMLQFPTSNRPICLSEQLRVIAHRIFYDVISRHQPELSGILESFCCGFHWNKRMKSRFSSDPGKSDMHFWWARTSTHQWRANMIRYAICFCSGFQLFIKVDLLLRGLFNGTNAPSSTSQVFSPFFFSLHLVQLNWLKSSLTTVGHVEFCLSRHNFGLLQLTVLGCVNAEQRRSSKLLNNDGFQMKQPLQFLKEANHVKSISYTWWQGFIQRMVCWWLLFGGPPPLQHKFKAPGCKQFGSINMHLCHSVQTDLRVCSPKLGFLNIHGNKKSCDLEGSIFLKPQRWVYHCFISSYHPMQFWESEDWKLATNSSLTARVQLRCPKKLSPLTHLTFIFCQISFPITLFPTFLLQKSFSVLSLDILSIDILSMSILSIFGTPQDFKAHIKDGRNHICDLTRKDKLRHQTPLKVPFRLTYEVEKHDESCCPIFVRRPKGLRTTLSCW